MSKEDEPRIFLWPTESSLHIVPSAVANPMRPTATLEHTAPQFIETGLSLSVARSSLSSQPLFTIIQLTPTSFWAPELSGSAAPTPFVVSLTSVSSISSTGSVLGVSDSVPLPSISVPPLTVTPPATSVVTLTPTDFVSSSAEVAAASVTPTETTVTETPSSSPSAVSSEDSTLTDQGHHAPFYIAVIVGSILAIGLIAAVVAWVVRLRMHARRRRENPHVPWANHHEDDDGLEAGRDAIFIGEPIDRIGSKDISSQDAVPWEPLGDRDVGTPKRSDSYVRSSMRSSLASGHGPYTEYQHYPVSEDSVAYPVPLYHGHTLARGSYSGSSRGHRSNSSLGPLQVANMTPGDASPSLSCTSPPVSMYTARTGSISEYGSRTRTAGSGGSWDTLPLPGQTQGSVEQMMTDDSSWTASLRSNFTYAFNAVAASLPTGTALMINKQDKSTDVLTPQPTRSSGRRSLGSIVSRNDSVVCKPWTLEERGDGTGRVLFHDVRPENPQIRGSFDSPSRASSTRDSFISQPSQPTTLRPNVHNFGSRHGSGRGPQQPSMRSSPSSASSISAYSMSSGVDGSAPRLPALSRHSTIKLDPMATVYEKKEEDDALQPPKRPATLATRSSSSGCSVTAYYYGADATFADGGESTESEDSIQQTLVDRRKFRRVV
ncbi:hypothetical protein DXG01_014114 [Tephrocybe rancida]|nr:hypothetical protein DXG01_014114 [Tephrocybe rancida]